MKLLIDIQDTKSAFFIELLNSLDFVSIVPNKLEDADWDWADDLTLAQRKQLEASLDDLDAGRVITHQEVRANIDKWINERR